MPQTSPHGLLLLFSLLLLFGIQPSQAQSDTLPRLRTIEVERLGPLPITTLSLPAVPDRTSKRWKWTNEAETGVGGATSVRTPFWLRVNQYGTVPLTSPAGWMRFRSSVQTAVKPGSERRAVRVKFGAEVAAMLSVPSSADRYRLLLVEGYAQIRWRRWEIYGGRRRDVFGLVDTTLTSGSFSWSGNAVPLPRVQFGTWDYVPVPLTKKWLAFNAMYAHGWFGSNETNRNFYLHQKALFLRFGKPTGAFRVYAGLTHYAQWGGQIINSRSILTPNAQGNLPSSFKDYQYVIFAQQPPEADSAIYGKFDGPNRVGNHLGTMDAAIEWTDEHGAWMAYMQHPFEDKSGLAWTNWPDGLYGIRWQRRAPVKKGRISLTHVTFEGLSTTDQSLGAVRRGLTQYDPNDNYFNNGQFIQGWTYHDHSIGTPVLTRRLETTVFWQDKVIQADSGRNAISGNTAQMVDLAMMGNLPNGWPFRVRLSQSWYDPNYNLGFTAVHPSIPQSSGSVDVGIPWRGLGGCEVRTAVAFDAGNWLRNSLGFQVRLVKRW